MTRRAHGQIRSNQVITTYGPGALIDLPRYSAIVGGLDTWPKIGDLKAINEQRLTRKLEIITGVMSPKLFAPPPAPNDPREPARGNGGSPGGATEICHSRPHPLLPPLRGSGSGGRLFRGLTPPGY